MTKFELSVVSNKRDCGECQACCDHFPIPELDKARQSRCQHQCDKGCAIWGDESRPRRCREFECGWLTGLVGQDERHRPDKSGVIFTDVELPGVGYVPTCIELRKDAASEYWVTKTVNKIGKKHPFVIFDVDKKIRTIGKPLAVATFKQVIERAFHE